MDKKLLKNEVTHILHDKKLLIMITAPQPEAKINLPCPFHCSDKFYKKSDLHNHLKKIHSISNDFKIELQYYCVDSTCPYHMSSDKNKWFSGRKFLNQHHNKVHKDKTYYCNDCSQCFSTETEFYRHTKTCKFVYICQICEVKYDSNDKLMVHLKRKHPDIHKRYKKERKAEKRTLNDKNVIKKMKTDQCEADKTHSARQVMETRTEASKEYIFELETKEDKRMKPEEIEFCDSPKKTLAKQIPEDIKNDVTLPSWQLKTDFLTKTDENSTQTVFEDILSLKSQNSEDEIFFSEAVSLSDIQTQTFPLEFGLSRSNKETQSCINSETQSPDLSIKETQTCYCHYESPKPNFRLFESLSSSPGSINQTSAETQTADHRFSVKTDVLLGYNSAETQTCFDESSNDCM